MASPVLELQGAIIARLKSYGALTAMIGQRVYDDVPTTAEFPYVSLGPIDSRQADAECIEAQEIVVQVDVWSRSGGNPESMRLAEEVQQALHLYETSLPTNALALLEHDLTRHMHDPDGLTRHAAIQFLATVEKP